MRLRWGVKKQHVGWDLHTQRSLKWESAAVPPATRLQFPMHFGRESRAGWPGEGGNVYANILEAASESVSNEW